MSYNLKIFKGLTYGGNRININTSTTLRNVTVEHPFNRDL